MFRIAAGKSRGGDPLYALLYAVPCLVALLRISLQGSRNGSNKTNEATVMQIKGSTLAAEGGE